MSAFDRVRPILDETLAARGYALKTRKAYRWAVQQFDRFVGAEPLDEVGIERLAEYQRHLAVRDVSYSAFRVATCALRFFYRECLRRTSWDYTRIPFQRKPARLPEIVSAVQAQELFDAAPAVLYRAIFMTAYGCGLRLAEIQALRPSHIDSRRMVVHVEQGKGKRDRYVMLPERLLPELRACWRQYRPKHFLFEGKNAGRPVSQRSIARALHLARQKAGITKNVTIHSLRHAFGTHLLEAGVNLCVIQALLGHRSISTTQVYVHLARTSLVETKSPLDRVVRKEEVGS
jgi:integrase/recombinase XerD